MVNSRRIELGNPDIEQRAGMIDFYSKTIRAFKLDLEDICEDYGQVAYYQGTLAASPHQFLLDDHHLFKTGQPMLVCGNTAAMVGETRYRRHFRCWAIAQRTLVRRLRPSPGSTSAGTTPTGACCWLAPAVSGRQVLPETAAQLLAGLGAGVGDEAQGEAVIAVAQAGGGGPSSNTWPW